MTIFYVCSVALFTIRTIADKSGERVSNDINVIATVVSIGLLVHSLS